MKYIYMNQVTFLAYELLSTNELFSAIHQGFPLFGRSKPASWRKPAGLLLFIKDLLLIVIIIIIIIVINSTLSNRLQCNYVEKQNI